MSKDWTQEELQQASRVMKAAGHMGYEEFCESLEKGLTAFCKDGNGNLIRIVNFHGSKEDFRTVLEREYPPHTSTSSQCYPRTILISYEMH